MAGVAAAEPNGGVLAELRGLLAAADLGSGVSITENSNPGTPANEVQIAVTERRREG